MYHISTSHLGCLHGKPINWKIWDDKKGERKKKNLSASVQPRSDGPLGHRNFVFTNFYILEAGEARGVTYLEVKSAPRHRPWFAAPSPKTKKAPRAPNRSR